MDNENINNIDLPKEIKADNENINPLLDIISSIQEKLDTTNQNNPNNSNNINNSNTYANPNSNFNFANNNMNMGFNSNNTNSFAGGFDTSKLFEILGNISGNNQKTTSSASNPFANLDMDTMMRLGKIFTSMNKEDPRKNLLLSLKPFLRNDRQKNVDTYIFVLGILNVLDSFNNGDSGF